MSVELDRVKKAIDELCSALEDFAAKKGIPGVPNIRPMLQKIADGLEVTEVVIDAGSNPQG